MGEDRDDRNGRWWSQYETQRRVEDLECDLKDHRKALKDHADHHVSVKEFERLRTSISRVAWLVIGQLIVVIGVVISAYLVARVAGGP